MNTPHQPLLPRRRFAIGALSAALALATLAPAHAASLVQRDANGKITALPSGGMNLSPVNDYSRTWPFANGLKASRGWWRGDSSLPSPDNDAQGYPTSLPDGQWVYNYVLMDAKNYHPTGTFVLTWDGQGDVRLKQSGATATLATDTAGRRVYNVTSNTSTNHFTVEIRSTTSGNHARNIKLWLPKSDGSSTEGQSSPFHPSFIADLQPFPVIRFMDWATTNESTQKDWADRRLNDYYTFSDRPGVPWETVIALGNELDRDIWINIPHQATDDYVTQLATLVKNSLETDLDVWVEYTNEHWNSGSGFKAHYDYIKDTLAPSYGWSATDTNASRAYGRRSKEIWDIFQSVLGGTDRLVRVVAGQKAWDARLANAIKGAKDAGTTPDVAAITYYYGAGADTLDGIFARATEVLDSTFIADIAANAGVAALNKIPLVAYEGQIALHGDTAAKRTLYTEAMRDPRMYDTYQYSLKNWTLAGGLAAVGFTDVSVASQHGTYFHKEYTGQPSADAHPHRALADWIAAAESIPTLTYTGATKRVIEAEKMTAGANWTLVSASGASGGQARDNTTVSKDAAPTSTADHLTWSFYVNEDAFYTVWIRANAPDSSKDSIWVKLDDLGWSQMNLSNHSTAYQWNRHNNAGTSASRYLRAGRHTLTLAPREGGSKVDQVVLVNLDGFSKTTGAAAETATDPRTYQQDSGSNGIVSIEAENNTDGQPRVGADAKLRDWAYISDTAASGSAARKAGPDTGANYTTWSNVSSYSPRLDFKINFVKSGTHYVYLRVKAAPETGDAANADSLHIGFDGSRLTSDGGLSSIGTSYSWRQFTLSGVTTGVHTLNLWMREDGLVVDKVVASTNSSASSLGLTSTSTGPAESTNTP